MLDMVTELIANGDVYDIEEVVQKGIDAGIDSENILQAMMEGLEICGKRFEAGEYYLPELMMSADAFKEGMKLLAPELDQGSMEYEGTVVLGTVNGDVHNIGKNLVGFLLKGAGFNVIDIGDNVPVVEFVAAVKRYKPDVLGLSALLTTTMLGMKDVVEALNEENLRGKVKVIIGGGPVSKKFAESIGADAYAFDAAQGVRKVKQLLGQA